MAHYSSLEQTLRTRKTEAVLNQLDTILRDPALQRGLGNTAAQLLSIIHDQAYIPNVRHGVITAPKGALEDGIPFTTRLYDEEPFLIEDPAAIAMTPNQELMLARYLTKYGYSADEIAGYIVDTAATHRNTNTLTRYVSGDDSTAATAIFNATPLRTQPVDEAPDGMNIAVYSRPIVVFGADLHLDDRAGFTGFHETVHAHQVLTNIIAPTTRSDERRRAIRDELVAYDTTNIAASSLYHYSVDPTFKANKAIFGSVDVAVSRLIHEKNAGKPDVYDPNEELYQEIVSEVGAELI